MGGTIAITIRVDAQNTYKMLRWTNPIPDFVHDVRFLNKDRDYLMEYIDRETEYGGKGQALAPDGYGLIVVDCESDTIISFQGYSFLKKVNDVRMTALIEPNHIVLGNDNSNLVELWKADKFTSLSHWMNRKEKTIPLDNQEEVFQAVKDIDAMKDWDRKRRPYNRKLGLREMICMRPKLKYPYRYAYFNVDLSPFTLIEYPQETKENYIEMRGIVESLFTLSDEEKKLWDEYLVDRWEEE